MQIIKRTWRRGCVGKVLVGCGGLIVASCICAVPLALLGDVDGDSDAAPASRLAGLPAQESSATVATQTPLPTFTPTPVPGEPPATVPTDTAEPTPLPNQTPSAQPTDTPEPSTAPDPTWTPIPPTNTPQPADTPEATPTDTPIPAPRTDGAAHVLAVVDGDTIEVEIDGVSYRVRYIGVDTPEQGAPWCEETTQANANLVAGRDVWLEKDVSETDRYDRLLRYVYVDEMMVNEELLRSGMAQVATFPPDVRYADRFLGVQQQAQAAGVGLWASRAAAPPEPTLVQPPPAAANCDPSYPDVCIPPPPPDLDCGQIPHRRFAVLAPDPHGFDGDHNGIGCEK